MNGKQYGEYLAQNIANSHALFCSLLLYFFNICKLGISSQLAKPYLMLKTINHTFALWEL